MTGMEQDMDGYNFAVGHHTPTVTVTVAGEV